MEQNPEESSIERLKRNLYSRNENLVPKEKRTPVSPHYNNVRTDWGDNLSFDITQEEMTRKNNSFFNKFLLVAVAFFVLSLSVAGFIFFGGLNMISSNNLNINIVAPSSISSGEEMLAALSIVNANRTDLEEVTLFIDYPEGAKAVDDSSKPLIRDKVDLGTIAKGKSADHSLRAVLFGEKDAVKTFTLRLEYRVKGSNAVFSKQKTFDVSIGSSPIIMDISYPKEVNSGQTVSITINLTSNSNIPVKNTLVKIEYPYGFTYKNSNINPVRDNTIWKIGDLKDGDKKTLTITGTMIGQNLEDRSFRVSVGSQSLDNTKDFDTTLATGIFTMGIRKSFFDTSITTTQDNVINPGQDVPVNIRWQNTLPDKVVNTVVEATVSGNAYDRNRISVSAKGFYRSLDNTVVWDKNTSSELMSIMPGESRQISFNIGTFSDFTTGRLVKNPHIDIHLVIRGDRSGADTSEVSSEEDVTIKISSVLGIKAKTLRDAGPFSNTGPIPPRADKETTYTITWTLTNSTNDIKNTTVSGILPAGVVWKGEVSPSGEKIDFNPDTKKITWNAGSVSTGIGYGYAPREVSFKVGVTPSLSQVGSEAVLVSAISASATDTYAEKEINADASYVTTRYADASFSVGKEVVGK